MNQLSKILVLKCVATFACLFVGCDSKNATNSSSEITSRVVEPDESPTNNGVEAIQVATKDQNLDSLKLFVGPICISSPGKPLLYMLVAESEFGPIKKMVPFVFVVDLDKDVNVISKMDCFSAQGPDFNSSIEIRGLDPASGEQEIDALHSFLLIPGGGFEESMEFMFRGGSQLDSAEFNPVAGRLFEAKFSNNKNSMTISQFESDLFSLENFLRELNNGNQEEAAQLVRNWYEKPKSTRHKVSESIMGENGVRQE